MPFWLLQRLPLISCKTLSFIQARVSISYRSGLLLVEMEDVGLHFLYFTIWVLGVYISQSVSQSVSKSVSQSVSQSFCLSICMLVYTPFTPSRQVKTSLVNVCFCILHHLLASQLVDYPHGNGLEVIFGGGREKLMSQNETDPEYPNETGERLDGRNLIKEWIEKYPNSQYVWNKTGFDKIDPEKVDRVMG